MKWIVRIFLRPAGRPARNTVPRAWSRPSCAGPGRSRFCFVARRGCERGRIRSHVAGAPRDEAEARLVGRCGGGDSARARDRRALRVGREGPTDDARVGVDDGLGHLGGGVEQRVVVLLRGGRRVRGGVEPRGIGGVAWASDWFVCRSVGWRGVAGVSGRTSAPFINPESKAVGRGGRRYGLRCISTARGGAGNTACPGKIEYAPQGPAKSTPLHPVDGGGQRVQNAENNTPFKNPQIQALPISE